MVQPSGQYRALRWWSAGISPPHCSHARSGSGVPPGIGSTDSTRSALEASRRSHAARHVWNMLDRTSRHSSRSHRMVLTAAVSTVSHDSSKPPPARRATASRSRKITGGVARSCARTTSPRRWCTTKRQARSPLKAHSWKPSSAHGCASGDPQSRRAVPRPRPSRAAPRQAAKGPARTATARQSRRLRRLREDHRHGPALVLVSPCCSSCTRAPPCSGSTTAGAGDHRQARTPARQRPAPAAHPAHPRRSTPSRARAARAAGSSTLVAKLLASWPANTL